MTFTVLFTGSIEYGAARGFSTQLFASKESFELCPLKADDDGAAH